jgi:hypothetical protein
MRLVLGVLLMLIPEIIWLLLAVVVELFLAVVVAVVDFLLAKLFLTEA